MPLSNQIRPRSKAPHRVSSAASSSTNKCSNDEALRFATTLATAGFNRARALRRRREVKASFAIPLMSALCWSVAPVLCT